MQSPDRVDFDDTDRLDALVARAERRVPRYPDPAPIALREHRRLIRLWAWCRAARLLARDFWAEFVAYVRAPR